MLINNSFLNRIIAILYILFTLYLGLVNSVFSAYLGFGIPKLIAFSVALFLISFAIFLCHTVLNKKTASSKTSRVVLLLLLLYFIQVVVILSNKDLQGYSSGQVKNAIEFGFPIILLQVMYIYMGGVFFSEYAGRRKIIFDMFFLFYLVTFLYFGLDFVTLKLVYSEVKIEYLFVGDFTAILFMIAFGSAEKKITKLVVFTIGLVFLFIISSRSSFYIYIFAFTSYWTLRNIKFRQYQNLIAMFILAFLLLIFYDYIIANLVSNSDDYRIFRVFTGTDNSAQGRDIINQYGYDRILQSWFVGDFGGQLNATLDEYGSRWGQYIHNVFSVWRQFGLIAFVIYIIILLDVCYNTITDFFNSEECSNQTVLILLCVFTVTSVLISRAYIFTSIYFFIGYYLFYFNERRKLF